MPTTYKQIAVDVFGTDCTNGGASSGLTRAILEAPNVETHHSGAGMQRFRLIVEDVGGAKPGRQMVMRDGSTKHVRAIPVDHETGEAKDHGMFGGNWCYNSDSRFPCCTPVPIFDRFE